MDAWTFIWLMVFLKLPIVALFLIVRWAIKATPEPETGTGQDGGIGPRPQPRHPHRPRTRLPRRPQRRGPHGEPAPPSPARMRTVARGRRLARG